MPESARKSFSLGIAMAMVVAMLPSRTLAETEPGAPIGSLSAAGAVELRSVDVAREATLFSGDSIRTSDASYARLMLLGGQQIELGSNTGVDIEAVETRIDVAMHTGSIAFAAAQVPNDIRVEVASYEILADGGSAGDITFLDSGEVGVRTLEGTILIRSGGEMIEVPTGEGRLLQLAGPQGPTAPAEAPPEGSALGSMADTLIWTSVVGVVSGVVIYQLLTGGDAASPSAPE